MADVELLPLPEFLAVNLPGYCRGPVKDYARANMEPLRAEVERLRRELDDAAVALMAACQGLAEFEGFERAQHEAFNRAEAACRKAIDGIKGDSND